MTGLMVFLAIIVVSLIVLAFMLIGMYNSLVGLRNQVQNAWAQIDVQLKRRHDLIPNLVETAKGYMKHERDTLENIAKARSAATALAGGAGAASASIGDISKAESALSGMMTRFFAVAENYPELKANTNFLALQEELSSTENKIAFARQAYNDQVLFFNNKTQMFPSNVIAGMFGFQSAEFFEIEDVAEKVAPKVSF
jgi:LemA protein